MEMDDSRRNAHRRMVQGLDDGARGCSNVWTAIRARAPRPGQAVCPPAARLVVVLLAAVLLADRAPAVERKLIAHGWDLLAVRPADVAAHLDEWAALPVAGVSLRVRARTPEGTPLDSTTIFTDPPWHLEWMTNEIAAVRACAARTLRSNLLVAYWSGARRLPWTDDAAWARVAHNHAVLARIAREGAAIGLMVDPEDYQATRQFTRMPDDPPWPEVEALARRRGRELMAAMGAQFPDLVLLSFWLLSFNGDILRAADPAAAAREEGDLWPAFVNGLLDALPPAARLVDGDEHAYRYEAARCDFLRGAWRTHVRACELVAPEHRSTYASRVLAGFGIYLDMYVNPPDSPWYFGEYRGSRSNHLLANLTAAAEAADELIWVYGERRDWVRWRIPGRETNQTWSASLPGFADILDIARDRAAWARAYMDRLRARGSPTNWLPNGRCSVSGSVSSSTAGAEEGPLPVGWWRWRQDGRRPGVLRADPQMGRDEPGALFAAGVEEGCFGASVAVVPGTPLVVEAFAYGGPAFVWIGWKRAGVWNWSLPMPKLWFHLADRGGWRRACDLIEVPEGADELVVMLCARQREGDAVWFDDVSITPLPAW